MTRSTGVRNVSEPKERWIIVSFDGARGVVYGRRGKREKGPARALGTIAIPLDSIRDQIEAAGYHLIEGLQGGGITDG